MNAESVKSFLKDGRTRFLLIVCIGGALYMSEFFSLISPGDAEHLFKPSTPTTEPRFGRIVVLNGCCAKRKNHTPAVTSSDRTIQITSAIIPELLLLNETHVDDKHILNVPLEKTDIDKNAWKSFTAHPTIPEVNARYENGTSDCVPLAEWHSWSFPTCNLMHESDLAKNILNHVHHGEYRNVWVYEHLNSDRVEKVALKTLRFIVRSNHHRLDEHRIDALATERLKNSPNVVDIYNYCGNSVMNVLAVSAVTQLEHKTRLSPIEKLRVLATMASAVAAAHGIDGEGAPISLVHRDIRSSNFLILEDGTIVLHDFNTSLFLMRNKKSEASCGFLKPQCTVDKSPEECVGIPLTEKIDVYSLGNVLYFLLSGYQPYGYPEKMNKEIMGRQIVRGVTPKLPPTIQNNNDPAIVAIRAAMMKCFTYDYRERPSAREIADFLSRALEEIQK